MHQNSALRANFIPRPLCRTARAAGKPIWKFGPMANYRPERGGVDNDAVDNLRKIDAAIEGGAFVGFEIDRWRAGIEFLHHVSGEHEGLLVTLRGGYTVAVSERIRVSLGVLSTWADDDYMDTYFSIDADNASRSGPDTFTADAGVKDVGLRVKLAYGLSTVGRSRAWLVISGFSTMLPTVRSSMTRVRQANLLVGFPSATRSDAGRPPFAAVER